MAKKKLDELFQKQFKDFEQQPDDQVWKAIEASLDKKKRRLIPLWWKLGGVAAVLLLALFIASPFLNLNEEGENVLTNTEKNTHDSLPQNTPKKDGERLPTPDEPQLTGSEMEAHEKNASGHPADHPSNNTTSNPKNVRERSPILHQDKTESRLAATQKEKRSETKSDKAIPDPNVDLVNIPDSIIKKSIEPTSLPQEPQTGLEALVLYDSTSTTPKKQKEEIVVQEKYPINPEKGMTHEKMEGSEVAQNPDQKNETRPKDDTEETSKGKSIFDALKSPEEAVAETVPKKRWSVGPSIAPVYFDAFGEGSPVNAIFVSNTKSGETNLSYGLSIAYTLNDRLSIRSGLHKVDYGYDTRDVAFGSSLDGSVTEQLNNIDYLTTAGNLVVRSTTGNNTLSVSENAADPAFDVEGNAATVRNGSMTQQFGYLEVPVELNYSLVDRKFGVHLIGGVSSLFLVDNAVSLTSGNQTTQIGEANNLNKVNFSTNIGLGMDYDFAPNVRLNIEPVFKYQLNTFSQVDGNFNPFSVGIYSGLIFKF